MATNDEDIADTVEDEGDPDPTLRDVWARVHGQSPYEFGHLIHTVSRMRKALLDKALSPFGLTRSQLWVLANLARSADAPPLSQIELAQILRIKKAALGGLVLRMERQGLIERADSTQDRRVRFVSLSAKGRQALIDIQDVGVELNAAIVAGITPDEEKTVIRCLLAMESNIARLGAGG